MLSKCTQDESLLALTVFFSRVLIGVTHKLDFGRLCCVAGHVYQAVEGRRREFINILYLTRLL
jgi:hypothetical protein